MYQKIYYGCIRNPNRSMLHKKIESKCTRNVMVGDFIQESTTILAKEHHDFSKVTRNEVGDFADQTRRHILSTIGTQIWPCCTRR